MNQQLKWSHALQNNISVVGFSDQQFDTTNCRVTDSNTNVFSISVWPLPHCVQCMPTPAQYNTFRLAKTWANPLKGPIKGHQVGCD